MPINRATRYTGSFGNVVKRCAGNALFVKNVFSCIQDARAGFESFFLGVSGHNDYWATPFGRAALIELIGQITVTPCPSDLGIGMIARPFTYIHSRMYVQCEISFSIAYEREVV